MGVTPSTVTQPSGAAFRRAVRNELIETLADSEHALARDLAAQRELTHVALTLLHQREIANGHLCDECRRLRQAHRDERRDAA